MEPIPDSSVEVKGHNQSFVKDQKRKETLTPESLQDQNMFQNPRWRVPW